MDQTADTCADCARRNICQPDKPYTGFCQWRETEQTANMEQSNDTSNNDGCVGESRSGTRCPPMLLERDGDKSIYLMHGKKGEYDGVYAIWHGTTLTCYRSRDEAWNAWEKLKDDRTMRGD